MIKKIKDIVRSKLRSKDIVYVILRVPGSHPEDDWDIKLVFESKSQAYQYCEKNSGKSALDEEAAEKGYSPGQYVVHPTVLIRNKR